jgi:hypothetical protein
MFEPRPAAGWWGYAEVDRTIVVAAVVIVVIAAFAFLVRRFWRR